MNHIYSAVQWWYEGTVWFAWQPLNVPLAQYELQGSQWHEHVCVIQCSQYQLLLRSNLDFFYPIYILHMLFFCWIFGGFPWIYLKQQRNAYDTYSDLHTWFIDDNTTTSICNVTFYSAKWQPPGVRLFRSHPFFFAMTIFFVDRCGLLLYKAPSSIIEIVHFVMTMGVGSQAHKALFVRTKATPFQMNQLKNETALQKFHIIFTLAAANIEFLSFTLFLKRPWQLKIWNETILIWFIEF